MKLYYSPGACSLSPHIVLREAGLDFDLALASTKTKKLADGSDFYQINPKGMVPVLELDDGAVLRASGHGGRAPAAGAGLRRRGM